MKNDLVPLLPGAARAQEHLGAAVAASTEQMKLMRQNAESLLDPFGIFAPISHAYFAWLLHPLELTEAAARVAAELASLELHTVARLAGQDAPDVVVPQPDDKRFADPAWTKEPGWDIYKEWYLFFTRKVQDALFQTPGLSPKERRRAAFWWRKWLNAMAPTNYFFTNPVALRKAIETNGESLKRGFELFMEDVRAGTVRMTDPEDFKVGENLATTPGAVVFRNRMIELIHYAPTAAQVRPVPIVIFTPWINKFYVLDLQPKTSLVRHLVEKGFDVYITSWKNPGPADKDIGWDDYLKDGVDEAVRVARELSGAKQVHAVGYCVGGTLLSTYMAWMNKRYPEAGRPVASWTLFATLVDFQSPGDIEVFLDEGSVRWLADLMRLRGFLDGKEMATTFRLLRSNSLIWHYVVHGWLYGERPAPSDVLYWNMDTTRMPARMHEYYLREMYLDNALVRPNALSMAGESIDLVGIHQPLYAVASEDDHITPWRQVFRINNWVTGHKRFVLSTSGHILGIVNPPSPTSKRSYRAGPGHRGETADAWCERAEPGKGSWWDDWTKWLSLQCGEPRTPPPLASDAYPKLADAPGTYVMER
jgi:polyhydroxyalkanoate synthase